MRELSEKLKEIYGENLLAVILFGSYVFSRRYNDIDVIVILEDVHDRRKEEIRLRKIFDEIFDFKIFSFENFIENLVPGSFLSGLVLGYRIIYDRVGIKRYIKKFFEELAKHDYKIYRKELEINLSKIARTLIMFD